MKRRSERKKAVDYADKWFSLYIRKRDGACMTCTSPKGPLQCGHLYTRDSYSTRWDERNAYCQCSGCNRYHEKDPWPLEAVAREKGIDLDILHSDFWKTRKFTTEELRAIGDKYKEKYDA